MAIRSALLPAAVALMLGTALPGQDAAAPVDFVRDVLPLFKEHCWSCHGPTKQKGGLRLDVRSRALGVGASGRILVPGKAAESRLIQVLRSADPEERMPLEAAPL